MAGQRYKYSHVNPGIEAKFLKEAFGLLWDARCLSKICHASGAGVHLLATANEPKFKANQAALNWRTWRTSFRVAARRAVAGTDTTAIVSPLPAKNSTS